MGEEGWLEITSRVTQPPPLSLPCWATPRRFFGFWVRKNQISYHGLSSQGATGCCFKSTQIAGPRRHPPYASKLIVCPDWRGPTPLVGLIRGIPKRCRWCEMVCELRARRCTVARPLQDRLAVTCDEAPRRLEGTNARLRRSLARPHPTVQRPYRYATILG